MMDIAGNVSRTAPEAQLARRSPLYECRSDLRSPGFIYDRLDVALGGAKGWLNVTRVGGTDDLHNRVDFKPNVLARSSVAAVLD